MTMKLELYEGNLSIYLCVLNDKGGCLAVRLFDRYTGAARAAKGGKVTDEIDNIVFAARGLAKDPDSWRRWRDGMEIPGLVYDREVLNTARLAAHHDSAGWHIDNETMGAEVRRFIDTFDLEADLIAAADVGIPDCEECRGSGLIDEE